MKEKIVRDLLPEEVEVRVDAVSASSFTLVVYVTARAAMNLLDDTFGQGNWSKTVRVDKKSPDTNFYATCAIEVFLDDGKTITREDVGEDSKSPKAASSDAIKRAATNLIPSLRALYTIPTLRVKAEKLGITLKNGTKTEAERTARKKELNDAIKWKNFIVNSISFATGTTGKFVQALTILDEETGEFVVEYTASRAGLKEEQSETLTKLKADMAQAGLTEQMVLHTISQKYGDYDLKTIAATPNLLKDVYIRIDEYKKAKAEKAKAAPKANSVNAQLKGAGKKKEEEE